MSLKKESSWNLIYWVPFKNTYVFLCTANEKWAALNAPRWKKTSVLFRIIVKPFFLGLHVHTHAHWKRRPFPSVWRLTLLRSCAAGPRHCKGVLWHSTEVGNTRSPWAPPAPDLNHSRSQWPSACLPSCQAALSQTCCKHADNKFRKPSREKSKEKKWSREIKK